MPMRKVRPPKSSPWRKAIGLAELRFSQLFLAANHKTAASSNDDIAKLYMEDTRR